MSIPIKNKICDSLYNAFLNVDTFVTKKKKNYEEELNMFFQYHNQYLDNGIITKRMIHFKNLTEHGDGIHIPLDHGKTYNYNKRSPSKNDAKGKIVKISYHNEHPVWRNICYFRTKDKLDKSKYIIGNIRLPKDDQLIELFEKFDESFQIKIEELLIRTS